MDSSRDPEVIHIGEGRKEEDLEPFWKKFSKRFDSDDFCLLLRSPSMLMRLA
ncbi:MAG: hypothetical protein AB1478_05285 [Nitrospirota bacterium]